MSGNRREFLRKAGVSLAALGTVGALAPAIAFGQPFLAVTPSPVVVDRTITIIKSGRATVTGIETITILGDLATMADDSGDGTFLNLGQT